MKRLALLTLVLGVVLIPRASAQDSPWVASPTSVSADGISATVGYQTVYADFRITSAVLTSLSGGPGSEACTTPDSINGVLSGQTTSVSHGDGARADAAFAGAVPVCNGTYTANVHIDATKSTNCLFQTPCGTHSGDTTADVTYAFEPPPAADITAKKNDDRSVTITWTSPYNADNPAPPDFQGFAIARTDGDKDPEVLEDPVDGTEFRDSNVPAAGGTFTYSVLSRRGDGAGGALYADKPATTDKVSVTAAPTPSSSPTTTPTNSGSGGSGDADRSSSGSGGVSNGGSTRGSNPFLPKPKTTPTTLPDEGYESSLPYQQSEPGDEQAQAPLDIVQDEKSGGSGLARPIAVSLVLSVWAMHILYVTRAAHRANVLVPALEVIPSIATTGGPEPVVPPPPLHVDWRPADDDPLEWWASETTRRD